MKPLFKKEVKIEVKKYRAISLLLLIPKVKENQSIIEHRITFKEIQLYIHPSGFRANHSIDTWLSWLTNKVLNSAENGKHTGVILRDLQKIFDTLDHKILLDKMKCIGFSGKTK